MKTVTINDVSVQEFASLKMYLQEFHAVSFHEADGGTLTTSGRGVAGDLKYDEGARALTIDLKAVPPIVTPGYILGFLYDEIHARRNVGSAQSSARS